MEPPTENAEPRPQGTTQQRVPYNSGYGDFCFGRLVDIDMEENVRRIMPMFYASEHEYKRGMMPKLYAIEHREVQR